MTRPLSIVSTIELPHPVEDAWPYLVDWERLDEWMLEAREFRVVGDRREGVGVEATATIRIGGITTHDRVRVTRWEPPRILEIAHLGWVGGHGYMELSPVASGCSLYWREELVPPLGVVGSIGMRAFAPLLRRTFRRDLRVLRELIGRERG